ncbi:MAG: choice-of-anchor L domain-containing protein [Saprospiraceae bacterium]
MNQLSITSKVSSSSTWQKGLLALLLVAAFAKTGTAQFDVINSTNPPYDPQRLIEDVFLGEGVEVISVQYDGEPEALGYFTEETGPVGFSEGIVLTTGHAATNPAGVGTNEAASANAQVNNGSPVRDDNLEDIVDYLKPDGSQNIHDVARYTITFIPKGDKVKFRYVFASEEYPEFVCSDYNDIFGFFIDGPGISGPYERGGVNLAVVPGTTLPVTINSINPGTHGTSGSPTGCGPPDGSLAHSAFYVDNIGAASPSYDGMTTILEAEATVIPCQTYTIQITLGDVGDGVFDSGVFLEAKSFSTPVLQVDVETISLAGDIAEGCEPAKLVFKINEASTVDRNVPYTVSGTATPVTDYDALPGIVTIPAGATQAIVPISAILDGLNEPSETIIIEVVTDLCSTKTVSLNIVDREIPPVPLVLDTIVCPGTVVELDGTLPATVDTETTFTNTTPAFISPVNVPTYRDITVSGVQPAQLRHGLIARVCVDLVHNKMEDLDLFLFGPNGNYVELSTDNGGAVPGSFSNGCFTSTSAVSIEDPLAGPVFNGEYLPEGEWSGLWNDNVNNVNGDWRLQLIDDENGGSGLLSGWSITFEPIYSIDYEWSPAGGLSCTDCPNPNATVTGTTTYTIKARDTYGCEESASAKIALFPPTTAPILSCVSTFDQVVFNWVIDTPLVVRYEINIDNAGWTNVGLIHTDTVRGLAFNQTVNIQVRAIGNCDDATSTTSCTTQNCTAYTLGAAAVDAICYGASDGQVTLTPAGGTAPFTYTIGALSNSTGVFASLPAGNYTANVSDVNGCGGSTTFTIGQPPAIVTSVSVVAPTTCGDPFVATASAVSPAGGPYTYAWTGGLTGDVQSFSSSGTYYVTITDNAMCPALDSAVIVVPDVLAATYSVTNISCAGEDDAVLSISANHGTGTIEYGLNGVYGTTTTFTALAPNSYVLSARDALGCVVDTTIVITDPVQMTLTIGKRDIGCNGDSDGKAWVEVFDNRGPVTYSWSGSTEASDTLRNLFPGKVYITVTDSAGCSVLDSVELFEAGLLTATMTPDSVKCFGESTGSLQVNTLGGRGPYSFAWSTGVTTTDSLLSGLPQGAYSVVVSDSEGCSFGVNATIGMPALLRVSHTAQPVTCAGTSTGAINLNVTGGTGPYRFAWSDSSTDEDRAALASGTYDVVVTDANDCTIAYQVILQDPGVLTVGFATTNVSCFGYNDGSITSTPNGGLSPYVYAWTGPNGYSFFGPNPQQLVAGDYMLNFRDNYGCSILDTITITEPDAVILTIPLSDSICFGSSTGNTFVSVDGGTAPFQYLWDNGEVADTAFALSAGIHTVDVTDANACIYKGTTTVNSLPIITLELDQAGIVCYGDSNGTASILQVNYGGVPRALSTMTYSWRHDVTEVGPVVTGLGGRQEAVVTATDFRGCTAADSIVIFEPTPISATAVVLNDVSCRDGADGGAEISVEGGIPGYTYSWLSPVSAPTDAITNELTAGVHDVVGIDANGCTDTVSVTLREPDSLLANFEVREVNCFDRNSGFASIEVRGGVSPYVYAWPDGSRGTQLDSLSEGDYELLVTDANGCVLRDTAIIGTASTVSLSGEGFGVSCNGDRDGAIELNAFGGNGPYQYQISGVDFNIFSEFRYLQPNRYWALAMDRDGCPSDTMYLTVEEPQPIIVEAGEEIEIELGESVEMFAQVFNSQGMVDYLWLPNDSTIFSCQSCPNPTVRPTFQGIIQVQVIDSTGCEAEDYIRIKLRKELQALVPTGFTPNNDGRDDRLLIHGKAGTEVISFKVFDRWGDVVFADGGYRVNDENRGWNGRIKDAYANGGVYIWEAKLRYIDGAIETLTGQTTLVR